MSELDDMIIEASDNLGADMPDMNDWAGFDFDGMDEVSPDTIEFPDAADTSDLSTALENDGNDIPSEAEKAADYARSYGFDKAADYIERHYDGDEFIPENPIPITTRNMALDGMESENGVFFERRTADC